MKKNSIIIVLLIASICNGISQAITDSTITMIAFWQIGDEVKYEFTETIDKLDKGEKTLEITSYDVQMIIEDSTENSYRVKWNYGNYSRNYELKPYEEDLYEICSNIPIHYKTDEFGAFETMENWDEMANVADQAFTKWISDKKEIPDSLGIGIKNMLISMFNSEEQMNYWASDLRFFHYLYGAVLYRDSILEGIKYYTNPFIKKRMPGTEKVTVVSVDEENWIVHIKVESGIGEDEAKELMFDFMRKNMENLGIKDESEIVKEEMPNLAVTEELECIYDIESGYILIGSYSKLTKLNDDYKLTTYQYELKE